MQGTGMSKTSDPRLYHAHVARNREPILDVLRRVLRPQGLVLEVASGSGEHAATFAKGLPGVSWQPTDIDPRALASVAAHCAAAGAANLLAPLSLDVTAEEWPVARADARRKAELYAKAAGVKLGPVAWITEETGYASAMPMARAPAAMAPAVPISSGEDTLRVRITVGFELAR